MADHSVGAVIGELRQMVVTYIKQETTAPLKGAFRYVRLGLIGGLVAVLAAVFVAVGDALAFALVLGALLAGAALLPDVLVLSSEQAVAPPIVAAKAIRIIIRRIRVSSCLFL